MSSWSAASSARTKALGSMLLAGLWKIKLVRRPPCPALPCLPLLAAPLGCNGHLLEFVADSNCLRFTGLSFNLLALLLLAHAFIPRARNHTRKFYQLSYFNPSTGQYAIGSDDAYAIIFFIVLFTGLRAGFMEYILAPIGKARGITKRKELTRFSEQAWLLVYYSVFWTLGAVSC